MYEQFFGLRELPFQLTANPRYLYLTAEHREALSNVQYGLFAAKGITVLTGEAGTGKTTLLQAALQSDRCRNIACAYINNPALTRSEFIEMLWDAFNLPPPRSESKAVLLRELGELARTQRLEGTICALVVDEAQSLPTELLEEIRLLANIETATDKLLPVMLAGQSQLRDRLNEPGLRQLKQRVTLRCQLRPFDLQNTAAYILARVRTAGGDAARMFTRQAVEVIHDRSGGIPRTISVLCDNALLTGFALGRPMVDHEIVLEVARDFDLDGGIGCGNQPPDPSRAPLQPTRPSGTANGQEPESAGVAAAKAQRQQVSLFTGRAAACAAEDA